MKFEIVDTFFPWFNFAPPLGVKKPVLFWPESGAWKRFLAGPRGM
jgi:hypothetical protein